MDKRWQVLCGDAIEIMTTLEAGSVDAIVTDPPYCSGGHTESAKKAATHQGLLSETIRDGKIKWFTGDAMTTNGYLFLMRSIAVEAVRLLPEGGSVVAFCDWRMYPMLAGAMESSGLRLQNMIVWDKGSPALGTGFRPQHELAIHLTKGTGQFHSKFGRNVYGASRISHTKREHPTQKPVALMSEVIKVVCPVDGCVLDPFMGSGSTGVAALESGRRFMGIERDADYIETASRRMSLAQLEIA